MAISTIGASALDSDVLQLGKNLLINGAMTVDQRSGDTRTGFGASDAFICDRWRGGANGSPSARWTVSIETSGGPYASAKWLKCLCTTADGSPGSSEAFTLRQAMEAQSLQSLVTGGTLGAVTISGKAIAHADGASSITFPAKLAIGLTTSDGTARQYYTNVTFAAADTWTDFEITVPADGTATIDNNNGQGLNFQFGVYGGSGRQVAADATWENDGADSLASDSDNWADATNNYIGFTDVQLEAGSVATDFEHEDIGETLAKCQRYFRRWTIQDASSQLFGAITMNSTTNAFMGPIAHPVEMRASPTISLSNVGHVVVADGANGNRTCSAFTAHANATAWTGQFTVAAGTTGGGYIYRDGPNDLLYFQFTAEL